MGYGDSIVPTGLAAEVYCELLPTPKAAPERAVLSVSAIVSNAGPTSGAIKTCSSF
jgi:hypothetical protein